MPIFRLFSYPCKESPQKIKIASQNEFCRDFFFFCSFRWIFRKSNAILFRGLPRGCAAALCLMARAARLRRTALRRLRAFALRRLVESHWGDVGHQELSRRKMNFAAIFSFLLFSLDFPRKIQCDSFSGVAARR